MDENHLSNYLLRLLVLLRVQGAGCWARPSQEELSRISGMGQSCKYVKLQNPSVCDRLGFNI